MDNANVNLSKCHRL